MDSTSIRHMTDKDITIGEQNKNGIESSSLRVMIRQHMWCNTVYIIFHCTKARDVGHVY